MFTVVQRGRDPLRHNCRPHEDQYGEAHPYLRRRIGEAIGDGPPWFPAPEPPDDHEQHHREHADNREENRLDRGVGVIFPPAELCYNVAFR